MTIPQQPGTGIRPPVRLSVIVTIVDGGAALERCLEALIRQQQAPSMEILVPFDDSVRGLDEIRARFADVRFLEMGAVSTDPSLAAEAALHERFDRRRSTGLARARGEIVAMLEDRSVPRPDWARAIDLRHREPHWLVGGAIRNGVDRPLNWAVFFCDFGRYEPPLEAGPARWASDVNVSYKREALEATRDLWAERYHETTVHWGLGRLGQRPYLAPEIEVTQVRHGLRLGPLLAERFHWGRLFAYTRVREAGSRRALWALAAPLLPPLLFSRQLALRLRRRTGLGRFLRVSPLVLLLLVVWSLGEAAGYLTGRP